LMREKRRRKRERGRLQPRRTRLVPPAAPKPIDFPPMREKKREEGRRKKKKGEGGGGLPFSSLDPAGSAFCPQQCGRSTPTPSNMDGKKNRGRKGEEKGKGKSANFSPSSSTYPHRVISRAHACLRRLEEKEEGEEKKKGGGGGGEGKATTISPPLGPTNP